MDINDNLEDVEMNVTCEWCTEYVAAPGDSDSFCEEVREELLAIGCHAIPSVTRHTPACPRINYTEEAKQWRADLEAEAASEFDYRRALARDLARAGNSMGRMAP